MSRFFVGAIVTFLATLTIVGWVVIVPIGAVSGLVHGFGRNGDTAIEGVLWASRLTVVFSVLFGAFVAFGLAALFLPQLAATWAITLLIVAVVIYLLPRESKDAGK